MAQQIVTGLSWAVRSVDDDFELAARLRAELADPELAGQLMLTTGLLTRRLGYIARGVVHPKPEEVKVLVRYFQGHRP